MTRVLIGFSFNPMLSGDRSSGAIQVGLSGLLGLPLYWLGLCRPYPIRKYSIDVNIACGCSSVTIDPHSCTCMRARVYNITTLVLRNCISVCGYSIPQLMHCIFCPVFQSCGETLNEMENYPRQISEFGTSVSSNHQWGQVSYSLPKQTEIRYKLITNYR